MEQKNQVFKGEERESITPLYADHIAMTATGSDYSLRACCKLINSYHDVSGHKVRKTISELWGLNLTNDEKKLVEELIGTLKGNSTNNTTEIPGYKNGNR